MNKTISVTIGIPAHNEAANIGLLLGDISCLSFPKDCKLAAVIVVADRCVDATIEIAKSFQKQLPLKIISTFEGYYGLGGAQNLLVKSLPSKSYLILLNADVRINEKNFLSEIVTALRNENDLISVRPQPQRGDNLLSRVLFVAHQYKWSIFESFQSGDNIYTCCGVGRALSSRLLPHLHFSTTVGEDAASFLINQANHLKYQHLPNVKVYFQLPNNLQDHLNQSQRAFGNIDALKSDFSREVLKKAFVLPRRLVIGQFVKYFGKHPLEMSIYGLLTGFIFLKHVFERLLGKSISYRSTKSTKSLDVSNGSKHL